MKFYSLKLFSLIHDKVTNFQNLVAIKGFVVINFNTTTYVIFFKRSQKKTNFLQNHLFITNVITRIFQEWSKQVLRKVYDELCKETPDYLLQRELWCSSTSDQENWFIRKVCIN